MPIRLATRWQAEELELDSRLFSLLRGVAKEGSLNRAVTSLRLSYRHAWGLLGKMERALGHSLVTMERGRGAHLTPFAEQLIEADDAAVAVLTRELAPTLQALNREADALRKSPRELALVIHASHDLALAELRDVMAKTRGPRLDLHFRGSLECLSSLARSECDIAGFHLPEPSAGAAAFAPYRPLLGTRGLRLIRFVHRSQGLMVARGNPKRLLSLADLAKKEVRFVNRQPDSGTRLCFDRLLAEEKLKPAQIRGYQTEEFTHAAIAATIASGMADAGFGIEAAARQHGLDFVALADERYLLAARSTTLARSESRALLEAMKGPDFLERLKPLPGYDAGGIGEIISVAEALRVA